MNRALVVAACASLLVTGCVAQGKYDEAVRSADAARTELARTKSVMQHRIDEAELGRASMQKELEEKAAEDPLVKILGNLDQDARSIAAEQRALTDAIETSRARADDLRRAQAAADSRAALYRDLALRFKRMIDVGDMSIALRGGRMVLLLSNDVLFESGRSELRPDGKRRLTQVAAVLSTVGGRRFQVAGHTDTEPIRMSPYRSNWELSSARALEVTSFLIAHGVRPQALSAASYGEFAPEDSNDTTVGKARNRRTEITVQPNTDEMVTVP